ncbi:hypothetical protein T459_18641 [Capsicum annuum]|uniref:Peptidase A1 domain-containing protein n=1 Tax=Capsicum annuum TaxID=4072 RepID=A0A2G2YZG1_CAPAN|nr:hypothetical protein T459_18641 [Capsicum annuum]
MEGLLLLIVVLISMDRLNSVAFSINGNLYFKINKTTIAQTRKAFVDFDTCNLQDPPMPPNSVSVYHLDLLEKSKFKDYESLFTHRLTQDQARATYLVSELRQSRDKKGINDQILKATHVTYYQRHYVASFMIGSERIRNFLLIDTGSYLSWWQCAPCLPNKCYKQAFNAIYNYTTSTTFKHMDCVDESGCLNSVFRCNVDSRLCKYAQTYDNGEKTKGFLGSDIIRFVGDNTQARIIFGCGIDQKSGTSEFGNTYSGIIALEVEGEEEMQFPTIRLFFGNVSVTQELKLEQDRVVKNLNGYYCLAILPWDDTQTLIGTHQLQGTGLTFDLKNNALTFSVDACD